ncbi:hypothetical protein [Streptomyces canus]|nr:hypothetical protein [Streptomyces canus]
MLSGLWAQLCDDVDTLDGYLPPHVAELAQKIAGVLGSTAAGHHVTPS